MIQQDLFDSEHLYRRTDPETSKLAAEDVVPKLGELQGKVVELVSERPGRTANEYAKGHPNAESLRKRFHEVFRKEYIKVYGERQCRVTGKTARTWCINE